MKDSVNMGCLGAYDREKALSDSLCIVWRDDMPLLNQDELTEREQNILHTRPKEKQKEWLIGRTAGKKGFRLFWGKIQKELLSLTDFEILPDENGCPIISMREKFYEKIPNISIAHTGGIAVAQISFFGRSVGIDIERVRELRDSTVRAFLSDSEYSDVCSHYGYERDKRAMLYWTLKEAYLKAKGVGIRTHPARIEVGNLNSEEGVMIRDSEKLVTVSARWTITYDDYIIASVCIH